MAKQYFNLNELQFAEKLKRKNFKDLEGQTFGRLKVLGFAGVNVSSTWFCICDCGNIVKVFQKGLLTGGTKSCGCIPLMGRSIARRKSTVCSMSNTPEYKVYSYMLSRCNNPNTKKYARYGGRGIKVNLTFEQFLAEVGNRPSPLHTINRIDNDKNYEIGNICWATANEQANNRSTNRFIEFSGKTQTTAQWAKEINIRQDTLHKRLKLGWCTECALSLPTLPKGKNKCEHIPLANNSFTPPPQN